MLIGWDEDEDVVEGPQSGVPVLAIKVIRIESCRGIVVVANGIIEVGS